MGLTNKQKVFVAEYVIDFNATRAAIAAGYSEQTARQQGSRMLTNVDIAAEVKAEIAHRCMTESEVLTRLTEHARGDMGDFLDLIGGEPYFDFADAFRTGKTRLIRKLKTKKRTYVPKGDDEPVTETEVDFELYDAQSALEKIGRVHKMFTDKQENTTELTGALTLQDWRKQSEAARKQAGDTLSDFDDDDPE